jgi:hypothetical protein
MMETNGRTKLGLKPAPNIDNNKNNIIHSTTVSNISQINIRTRSNNDNSPNEEHPHTKRIDLNYTENLTSQCSQNANFKTTNTTAIATLHNILIQSFHTKSLKQKKSPNNNTKYKSCNEPVSRPTGESRSRGSGASPATSPSMRGI